ncbi:LysR family transcriptional regulator [Mycolicibacterium goodii]|uniref:LysR family transcriptional regulator n=1 Tax=Mycolicibacterium goodii TaxID=134601 RepID=UPI000C2599AE|nr:LysR family transcriptional regulator [Mycolicibacterium goodii]PJK21335.1 LysR family transcriptional regulator [Mycolicibacterium goodii]
MPSFIQLRTFLAVVEHGGFSAAGRFMNLSQPAVSRSVANLEKELGMPLLKRTPEGVVLTEVGKLAVDRSRDALRHWDQLESEIALMSGGVAGPLRLASLHFTTRHIIEPQVEIFVGRYPHVDVRILEGSEPEVRDWLDQGAAEAGVVTLPARGLTAAFLTAQPMLAVVPACHPLATLNQITYAQLSREPFVGTTGGCARVFMAVARDNGVEFDIAYEAHDMATAIEIVRAGLAVSILPAAAFLDCPSDVAVRPLVPKTIRHLAIAISASAGPVARAFLDQIAELNADSSVDMPLRDHVPNWSQVC